ncbi:MAG TPA: hypothetical protein VF131_00050 [Blastocatellia bacterium]|nr:hypothetical protein [Blastocatellia bacterium]
MPETKIIYSGFYDFPLAFIATYENAQYLFWRLFDDELDDFPSEYDVYILPDLSKEEIEQSWEYLSEKAKTCVGKIPVRQVAFDPTRRRFIDTVTFDRIVRE